MSLMIQEKINQGSLLYHPVHGLCRVEKVMREKKSGKESLSYSLEPKVSNKMKVRFVIAADNMEASGFHPPATTAQANRILKYLKEGDEAMVKAASEYEPSFFAKEIITFSRESQDIKDQRNRQRLERSVNGLVGELAYALKQSLKQTATQVRKSLGSSSKINPQVLVALENAGEE